MEVALATTLEDELEAEIYPNLGIHLNQRYLGTGEIVGLEEAIRVGRMAVEATPAGHMDGVIYSTNLENRLGDKYTATGTI